MIHGDKPIFEMDLVPSGEKHIKEYFLIHSSLDTIDMMVRSKKDYYLGQIKSDDTVLYAYVNPVRNISIKKKLDLSSSSVQRKKSINRWKKISDSFSIGLTRLLPWHSWILSTSPKTTFGQQFSNKK